MKKIDEKITRLLELRKTLELRQGEFSRKLGLSQSTWASIELGDNPLAERYIKLICLTFNVSEKWLKDGDGEMFAKDGLSDREKRMLEMFRELTDSARDFILETLANLLKQQRKEKASEEANPSKKSG